MKNLNAHDVDVYTMRMENQRGIIVHNAGPEWTEAKAMSEQNKMAEKVLEYLERSFTDPSFRPIMGGDLEIVMSGKMPEQYVRVSDVFKVITQFADALTAKGKESFTPLELQLTLFTLIADEVVDKDVLKKGD